MVVTNNVYTIIKIYFRRIMAGADRCPLYTQLFGSQSKNHPLINLKISNADVKMHINILSLKQYKFYYLYDIISADADIIKI